MNVRYWDLNIHTKIFNRSTIYLRLKSVPQRSNSLIERSKKFELNNLIVEVRLILLNYPRRPLTKQYKLLIYFNNKIVQLVFFPLMKGLARVVEFMVPGFLIWN